MPRSCTICAHPERYEIDTILVSRAASYRVIASQYSLTQAAIGRHVRGGHIAQLISLAADAENAARADTLLDRLEDLQARTDAALVKAEEGGEFSDIFRGIAEMRRNLEIIGEVTRELERSPTLNLHLNPQWIELRTVIVDALQEHPAALADVRRAIEQGEASEEEANGRTEW